MRAILSIYIDGANSIISVFSAGLSYFFKDKTLEDYQGKNYFEKEEDKDLVELTLTQIKKGELKNHQNITLSNGNKIEVVVN